LSGARFLRVRSNEMECQVLYYRAMADTSVPAAMDIRRERTESARLDNFVDGAFAFAITLLVISGASLPRDVDALEHALRGVPAFAACFAQLVFFWHGHVRWRDAVRLTDHPSLYLSLLLVFFALIFVFPLHLVFAGLFNGLSGGALSPDVSSFTGSSRGVAALFICYGTSFACMAGTLALLYRHAARAAVTEGRPDAVSLRVDVVVWGYYAAVGVLSTLLALTLPARAGWFTGLPGFSFFLLSFTGPAATRYRAYLTRKATS
jgi:hypothetical protein